MDVFLAKPAMLRAPITMPIDMRYGRMRCTDGRHWEVIAAFDSWIKIASYLIADLFLIPIGPVGAK